MLDVPVNLIMLDTSDTNTLRSGAAQVGPRAPVQVVWAKPLAGTIGALSLEQMLSLLNGTSEFDAYVLTGQWAAPTGGEGREGVVHDRLFHSRTT